MKWLGVAVLIALLSIIVTGCDSSDSGSTNNDDRGYKLVCSYSGKCGLGYDHGNGFVTHSNGQTGLGFGF